MDRNLQRVATQNSVTSLAGLWIFCAQENIYEATLPNSSTGWRGVLSP